MREEIKKPLIPFLFKLNKDLFYISLISYLVFYTMESAKAEIINNYFKLDIILWIVIITGVILIFLDKSGKALNKTKQEITKKDYLLIFGISLAGTAIILFKTKETLGWLSILVSLMSGALIFLISVLLLKDEGEDEDEKK